MRKPLLCLAMALILTGSAALADTPIWVDGNGHIISGPNGTITETITPDTSSSNSTGTVTTDSGDMWEDGTEETVVIPTATPDPNAPKKWEYEPSTLTAVYAGEEVEVVALGTRLTRIKVGRETALVRTSALTFDTSAQEGMQMAVIATPKSGRATMFKRASSKAAIIYKCQTNRIVAVKDTSKKFAHLHYADADGYVSVKSITYTEPWIGEIQTAFIAYKGNVRSRSTVKVRQKASGASRILDEFPCGTLVAVIGQADEKWTEIEVENLHCFILTEFLTEPVAWVEAGMMAAKEE